MEDGRQGQPDVWLTVDEAAEYLRVSRRTIYQLMDQGELAYGLMPGRARGRRVRRRDLDELLRRGGRGLD